MATQPQVSEAAPLTGLVPMIRVADVERSTAFYRLLGFEIGNKVPPSGPPHWAWLYTPKVANWKVGPNLMLVRGKLEVKPDSELVLFYLYARNFVELRNCLVAEGVKVSEISYPEYLPEGEFRTEDPDGYCLMVAQSGPNTP